MSKRPFSVSWRLFGVSERLPGPFARSLRASFRFVALASAKLVALRSSSAARFKLFCAAIDGFDTQPFVASTCRREVKEGKRKRKRKTRRRRRRRRIRIRRRRRKRRRRRRRR